MSAMVNPRVAHAHHNGVMVVVAVLAPVVAAALHPTPLVQELRPWARRLQRRQPRTGRHTGIAKTSGPCM